MTRDEKRCLRAAHNQLAEAMRELMWAALAGEMSAASRVDLIGTIRAIADRLERGND